LKQLLQIAVDEYAKIEAPVYGKEQWIAMSRDQLVMNLVREQVFQGTREEVPYEVDVECVQSLPAPKPGMRPEMDLTLWVSRPSLKPILVGRGGEKIRDLGTAVRKKYTDITGEDLILRLFVKVVEGWANHPQRLREVGYAADA